MSKIIFRSISDGLFWVKKENFSFYRKVFLIQFIKLDNYFFLLLTLTETAIPTTETNTKPTNNKTLSPV